MSEKLVHLQPTICIQQTLPIMTSFNFKNVLRLLPCALLQYTLLYVYA